MMTITVEDSPDIYEARRIAELEGEIIKLDKAMADSRRRIEEWVEGHPGDHTLFKNGFPVMRLAAMSQRHPDLRALETVLDNLVQQWNSTLSEFARLKTKVSRG